MERINFINFEGPALSAETLNQLQDNIDEAVVVTVVDNLNSDSETDALSSKQGKALKERIEGTVLFASASGVTENFSLTDSASNYDYIEIFGNRAGEQMYQKVFNPQGKSVTLQTFNYSDQLYMSASYLSFNNTSVTQSYNKTWFGSTVQTNTVKINRIVGYKIKQ